MPENSPSINADNSFLQYNPAFEGAISVNPIDDWFASVTGQLTSADKMKMNEERQRDVMAFQRELYADSTAMQRKVADYKAAGLNPYALAGSAVGQSVSAPSSATSSHRGSSLNLSDILMPLSVLASIKASDASAQASKASAKKSNAEADKTAAETNKIKEETRGAKLQNDFFEKMRDVREKAERLENDLKAGEKRRIYKDIDRMDSEIIKNIEESHTEQEKQAYLVQQSILANATAENITAMRPYIQAELSARTALERQQTRVAAVDEAYRQGLIDAGSIEAAVRLTNAQASTEEVNKMVKETEKFLKDYDAHRKAGDLGTWLDSIDETPGVDIAGGLFSGLSALSSSLLGK